MIGEIIKTFGYLGVCVLVFLLNLAPGFVPPTWVVLLFFYFLNPTFDIFLLAFLGAISSSLGRFCLLQLSRKGKILLSEKEKEEMEFLRKKLKKVKNFGFFSSLFVALTPLPSNAYFIALGLMDYLPLGVFLGFFLGRLITYFLPLFILNVSLHFIKRLLIESWWFHALIDTIGIISLFFFILIDWKKLLGKNFKRKKANK
ncbi:MAG: hypothetical protein ACPLXS_01785 [Candidatus Micrarchaeales archaeon]